MMTLINMLAIDLVKGELLGARDDQVRTAVRKSATVAAG